MSIEAKAAVQLQEVPLSEFERIATVFGYSFAAPPRHLAGGYASCNFAVSLVPLDGSSSTPTQAVLKFSNTCIDLADIEHQLRVLSHLQSSSYKTNYLLPRRDAAADAPLAARYLATADGGGPPLAMLVSFVVGTPGDKLLAASPSTEATMLASLGGALASLHGIEWPEPPLRHVSCGYPVCNTGELLDPSAAGVAASLDKLPDHPFVAFLRAPRATRRAILCARNSRRRRTPSRAGPRLARFRELFGRAGLPAGFIHGDGFLDNILCADDGALAALVDWEDSCVAPYVLDVAVAVSAAAFTASNELLPARCAALLRGYTARRPLSADELAALPDFMWAGALACGFYRWREFNLNRPESADDAKSAYAIMQQRCEKMEAAPPDAKAWVS